MVLTACPAPQPQVVEKVVTQIVEQKVEVVQTQIVEIEKVVEKEKIVVATVVPEAKPALLRINLGAYPDVIDPQKSSYVNEIADLKLIYEGLTKFNEALETVPGAAEKWEYNADATELTFTLQPGLKYSDGTPLNAKRFEYALIRNIDPETAGEYASITDEIKGAPEWRNADTAAADYDAEKFKAELGVKAMHADGTDCNADLLRGCRLQHAQAHLLQARAVLPHHHGHLGRVPGQGRTDRRGRRELVEQLQVPDRQRPLHPDEPGAVRARRVHPERQLLGRQADL